VGKWIGEGEKRSQDDGWSTVLRKIHAAFKRRQLSMPYLYLTVMSEVNLSETDVKGFEYLVKLD
jgi:hypothetical protein